MSLPDNLDILAPSRAHGEAPAASLPRGLPRGLVLSGSWWEWIINPIGSAASTASDISQSRDAAATLQAQAQAQGAASAAANAPMPVFCPSDQEQNPQWAQVQAVPIAQRAAVEAQARSAGITPCQPKGTTAGGAPGTGDCYFQAGSKKYPCDQSGWSMAVAHARALVAKGGKPRFVLFVKGSTVSIQRCIMPAGTALPPGYLPPPPPGGAGGVTIGPPPPGGSFAAGTFPATPGPNGYQCPVGYQIMQDPASGQIVCSLPAVAAAAAVAAPVGVRRAKGRSKGGGSKGARRGVRDALGSPCFTGMCGGMGGTTGQHKSGYQRNVAAAWEHLENYAAGIKESLPIARAHIAKAEQEYSWAVPGAGPWPLPILQLQQMADAYERRGPGAGLLRGLGLGDSAAGHAAEAQEALDSYRRTRGSDPLIAYGFAMRARAHAYSQPDPLLRQAAAGAAAVASQEACARVRKAPGLGDAMRRIVRDSLRSEPGAPRIPGFMIRQCPPSAVGRPVLKPLVTPSGEYKCPPDYFLTQRGCMSKTALATGCLPLARSYPVAVASGLHRVGRGAPRLNQSQTNRVVPPSPSGGVRLADAFR